MKIGIIEHEKHTVKTLEDVFRQSGTEIHLTVYASCQEAQEEVNKGFDLLIISNEMPDGSGIKLNDQVKSKSLAQTTPTIILSATLENSDFVKHQRTKTGANAYVRKPFDKEHFKYVFSAVTGLQLDSPGPGSDEDEDDRGRTLVFDVRELEAMDETEERTEQVGTAVIESAQALDDLELAEEESELEESDLEEVGTQVPPVEASPSSEAHTVDDQTDELELPNIDKLEPEESHESHKGSESSTVVESVSDDIFQEDLSSSDEDTDHLNLTELQTEAPSEDKEIEEKENEDKVEHTEKDSSESLEEAAKALADTDPSSGDTQDLPVNNAGFQFLSENEAEQSDEQGNDSSPAIELPDTNVLSEARDNLEKEPFIGESRPLQNQSHEDNIESSEEKRTLREYLRIKEKEVAKLSHENRLLHDELRKKDQELKTLNEERDDHVQKVSSLETENESLRKELKAVQSHDSSNIENLRFELSVKEGSIKALQEKVKTYERKYEEVRKRVKVDLNHIRAREQELENQLDLQQKDAESRVEVRDKQILELKRKIDSLQFELESVQEENQKIEKDREQFQEKMKRVERTVRMALKVLDTDLAPVAELLDEINHQPQLDKDEDLNNKGEAKGA
jgi:DNA-binding response OmpR family regulator